MKVYKNPDNLVVARPKWKIKYASSPPHYVGMDRATKLSKLHKIIMGKDFDNRQRHQTKAASSIKRDREQEASRTSEND